MHKSKININNKSDGFELYFLKNISNPIDIFIKKLQQECNLFLFSGIIRDYFLENKNSFRDIDLVYLSNNNLFDIDLFLKTNNYPFQKNSFGGYKISIDGVALDLWNIQSTWGIGQFTSIPFHELIYELIPKTTFFNFSSVIYSFKHKEFIYTEQFENFVTNKKIDIVLYENPNPVLCIINIFYYKEKLKLDLAENAINFFLDNYRLHNPIDFKLAQEKHFGKEIISFGKLEGFFSKYYEKRYLKIKKKKAILNDNI